MTLENVSHQFLQPLRGSLVLCISVANTYNTNIIAHSYWLNGEFNLIKTRNSTDLAKPLTDVESRTLA